jgi:hypothetical protein
MVMVAVVAQATASGVGVICSARMGADDFYPVIVMYLGIIMLIFVIAQMNM